VYVQLNRIRLSMGGQGDGAAFVRAAAGYALHLLSDMTTITGLAVFWPVWNRSLHLLPTAARSRTGGCTERLIYVALLTALLWQAFTTVSPN
jgi:membrane-bound metal-dependent hydrolase YbcI (DUF457 family)